MSHGRNYNNKIVFWKFVIWDIFPTLVTNLYAVIMVNVALIYGQTTGNVHIKSLLDKEERIQVVCSSQQPSGFQEVLPANTDVVLIEYETARTNGMEICRHLHNQYEDLRTLVFSETAKQDAIRVAFASGACGFVLNVIEHNKLATAILSMYTHGFYIDPAIDDKLRAEVHGTFRLLRDNHRIPPLFSGKELIVLKMACDQFSSIEMADRLHVNVRTIDSHRKNIMTKCGAKNFVGAIIFALRGGYISLE